MAAIICIFIVLIAGKFCFYAYYFLRDYVRTRNSLAHKK